MQVKDLDEMLGLSAVYFALGTLSENFEDIIEQCPESVQKELYELKEKADSATRKVEESMAEFQKKYNISVNGEV